MGDERFESLEREYLERSRLIRRLWETKPWMDSLCVFCLAVAATLAVQNCSLPTVLDSLECAKAARLSSQNWLISAGCAYVAGFVLFVWRCVEDKAIEPLEREYFACKCCGYESDNKICL